jgi:hypothetical protein
MRERRTREETSVDVNVKIDWGAPFCDGFARIIIDGRLEEGHSQRVILVGGREKVNDVHLGSGGVKCGD